MHAHSWLTRIRKWTMLMMMGTSLAVIGKCDLGEVTATTTLDGRDVVTSLLKGVLISPLENVINEGVDAFFDQITDDEDDD